MSSEKANQKFLENLAHRLADWTGNSWVFLCAFALTLAWVITGPLFDFSKEWQLFMSNISAATTFIMVFILQRAQSKSTIAMQIN